MTSFNFEDAALKTVLLDVLQFVYLLFRIVQITQIMSNIKIKYCKKRKQ